MPKKKKSRYGSYFFIDPETKRGYCKVQIPTGEKYANGKLKYKTIKKRVDNATHAEQIANEILSDYQVRKKGFLSGERMTFRELAEWYRETHAVPPVYSADGTKIAGIRTYRAERNRLAKLTEYFGNIAIKEIDEDVLLAYKLKRERDGVKAATINRDLEILRAMFRKAVRRRWLKENPFDFGEKLIEKSREKRREVILTEAEENLLLNLAKKSEKSLLYYALLCLIDTGARPSEIYDASTVKAEPVRWTDFLEFDFQAVRLTSYKGRQKIIRYAPVSERLEAAMRELWEKSGQSPAEQIFQIKSFKTAWHTVCRQANLKGIRLRDLRRSFSTKLANLGIENDVRQRILGHEQAQTTFDYTVSNLQTALRIREKLNQITVISEMEN